MSPNLRRIWRESRTEWVYELHLHLPNTDLQTAYSYTETEAKALVESKAFKKWQDLQNNDRKNLVMVVERTNEVISAINNLAKLLARR